MFTDHKVDLRAVVVQQLPFSHHVLAT